MSQRWDLGATGYREDGYREVKSLKARLCGTGSGSWTWDGWAGELDPALTLGVGYLPQVCGQGQTQIFTAALRHAAAA